MVTWTYYSQADVSWVKCSANVRVGCNDSLECFTPCMWTRWGKAIQICGKTLQGSEPPFLNRQNDSLMDFLIWIILRKQLFLLECHRMFLFLFFTVLYGAFQCKMCHYIASVLLSSLSCCYLVSRWLFAEPSQINTSPNLFYPFSSKMLREGSVILWSAHVSTD